MMEFKKIAQPPCPLPTSHVIIATDPTHRLDRPCGGYVCSLLSLRWQNLPMSIDFWAVHIKETSFKRYSNSYDRTCCQTGLIITFVT